ncbi:hypothetical protein S40293_11430 [Stachybotrys chartarum IBT 40293]|nr:hypothetical protein S40293_11430 [Stachybotrys chartarum IBT 40293]
MGACMNDKDPNAAPVVIGFSHQRSMFVAPQSVHSTGDPDDNIKDLFITTATRISDKVKSLLEEPFDQSHNLQIIQETLDHIKEIATDDLGDIPRMAATGHLQKGRREQGAMMANERSLLRRLFLLTPLQF